MALSLHTCSSQNLVLAPKQSASYANNCFWERGGDLLRSYLRIKSRKPKLGTSVLLKSSKHLLFHGDRYSKEPEWMLCRNQKTSDFIDAEKSNSFVAGGKFQLNHVIEAQQFDRDILSAIFEVAREMEKIEKSSVGGSLLRGYLMATLFYEPSTRTRLSFESAMKRLGGEVLTTENAREFSSASKGETLEDTIRTVEGYSDIIVMRHFERGAAIRAASTATIPIINAGDGPGEHPTQRDMYIIGSQGADKLTSSHL